MTTNQDRTPSLDEVLAEIAASSTPPDATQFRNWVNRYPQFKAEIVDFATDWIEVEAMKTPNKVTQDDVALVVNRTMSRIQQILYEDDRPTSLKDLAADIEAAGHDVDSFQHAVDIDRSILTCLVERMILPSTIPLRMVRAIAKVLNRDAKQVRDYLQLPPQRAAAAYRARGQPNPLQMTFSYIVSLADLSEDKKTNWLAEPPDPELSE